MDITPKFQFVEGSFDTKTSKMKCAFSEQYGIVWLYLELGNGLKIAISQMDISKLNLYSDFKATFSDAKALCEEIACRWNEFPEDLKK